MSGDEIPTLGFVLHHVSRLARKRFEQRARDFGMTRSQWQVLTHLAKCEGSNQGHLAEILDVEPITLARLIDKLEKAGLIERRSDPNDRRARLLYLTPAAGPMRERALDSAARTRAEATEGFSEEELTTLIALLDRVKNNLMRACERPIETTEIEK